MEPIDETLITYLQTVVTDWARQTFATEDVVVGAVELEDDQERFLVDVAAKPVGYWLLVEVWLDAHREVQAINDLGEGLPLDSSDWPWTSKDETKN